MEERKDVGVVVPCIRYYKEPGRIWNCGGRLLPFGWRKYFTSEKLCNSKRMYIRVTFVTGCAFLVRKEIFQKFGVLCEDFFFGEEDYEFSIRMRRNKVKMASVLFATIYHKVSSSISKLSDTKLRLAFIHHLNRLVHLKRYYHPILWRLIRLCILIYIFLMLRVKYRIDSKTVIDYIKRLIKFSDKLNKVSKETFDALLLKEES